MGIHSTAQVDASAQIDPTAEIGPFAVIGPDTIVGARTKIGAHVATLGDSWESFGALNDTGRSIVIPRTRRGQEIVHRAMAKRYIEATPIEAVSVSSAQENLLTRRREVFGRLFAMKLLLIPTPRYVGFSLFRSWIRLPLLEKARTILGTFRRLVLRGLWRRRPLFERL